MPQESLAVGTESGLGSPSAATTAASASARVAALEAELAAAAARIADLEQSHREQAERLRIWEALEFPVWYQERGGKRICLTPRTCREHYLPQCGCLPNPVTHAGADVSETEAQRRIHLDRLFANKAQSVRWVYQRLLPEATMVCEECLTAVPASSDSESEIAGVLGLGYDVTAHHAIGGEIRSLQELYRSIVEDQTELVCRFTSDGVILFVNDVICRFFGKKRSEIVGTRWHPQVFDEDLPRIRDALRELSPEHPVVQLENRVYDGQGQVRWMEFVNRGVFRPDGALREIQAVGREITKRRELEQAIREGERRFRAIFDSTFQFIGLMSPEGIVLEANKTALDAAGLTASDVLGKPFWETGWWADSEETRTQLRDAVRRAAQGEFVRYQVDIRGRDALPITIDFSLKPCFSESGAVVLLIPEGRDVTERQQAEERQRTAQRLLERSLAQRELLLKEVHHRVKNNLQIITSLLRLQSSKVEDEPVLDVLRESQNRVRAMALVHENIYFSENLSNVDFDKYIKMIVRSVFQSYSVSYERIVLELDLEPVELELDRAVPCGLIVNELLTNCVKHAFPGDRPGIIRIRLSRLPSPRGDWVQLSIQDNGIGLPDHGVIAKVRSLGLQLVEDLSDQLGGQSRIQGEHGFGVEIHFPLSPS